MASREVAVFVAILAFLAVLVYAVSAKLMNPFLVILGIAVLVALAYLSPRIKEFKEYERGVMFRFGRFHKVAGPGWVVLFPAFESFTPVDLRTKTIDTGRQQVTTKDNITLTIDAVSYIKIVNPKRAVLEVKDLEASITKVLEAEIRSISGRTTLKELIEEAVTINSQLVIILKRLEDEWGFQVIKAEIESIEIPRDLIDAQTRRKAAEEYKQKLETEALARQVAIETLDKAVSKISDKTLTVLYIDALKKIAQGKSNKIIFPLELTSLAAGLSSKLHKGKISYDDALEGLLAAYTEKQKELMDKNGKKGGG
ncbi:MAG: SPFH domain-containing protein [Candidatus Micrarchaeota archaeon]